jgi:hypothetical protein
MGYVLEKLSDRVGSLSAQLRITMPFRKRTSSK